MRLSSCYRLIRSKGFFVGKAFFPYKNRLFAHAVVPGLGTQAQRWLWQLSGGLWGLGGRCRRVALDGGVPKLRVWQNASGAFLRFVSPLIEPFWPLAWATLRYLKVRHFRGRRYRLGLPAKARRTHSNASTTRRVRGVVASYIKTYYWFEKLWEPRRKPTLHVRSRGSGQSRRAAKAERHKRGVIRTKKVKKVDVWR